MKLKFTKSTDSKHKIVLESSLVSASWNTGGAYTGFPASFTILTSFVGYGAPIQVIGRSEKGKKLGNIKGEIKNNKFRGEFDIPEDIELDDRIYFQFELPKNGISGESNWIPVFPMPRVRNMKWSAKEARRGDVLTLSANVENVRDYSEVKLIIYEYDQDGAHDRITELPAIVKGGKIEVNWEYEYHEDTDEIPTEEELKKYGKHYNPPEFFFTVKIGENEFGKEQESGLLEFKDWIELELKNRDGSPIPNENYIVILADGSQKEGKLDENGYDRIEDIPPGPYRVRFPNFPGIEREI